MACARDVDIVITRQCLTLQKHCASIQALTRRARAMCVYICVYMRLCLAYVCVCTYMCVCICMYARAWCPLSFDRYVMHKYFMTWATGARVRVRTLDHRIFSLRHLSKKRKKKKNSLERKLGSKFPNFGKNHVYTRDYGREGGWTIKIWTIPNDKR